MIGKTNASIGGSVEEGTTNPSNGVYILATDGKHYTTDEWKGKYTALCVSVITDNCRFGVALEDATIGNNFPGQNPTGIVTLDNSGNSLTSTSDKTTALNDFNGIGNTINMKSGTSTGTGSTTALKLKSASAACRGYQFLDGRLGYEGSAGEWGIISDNLESINSALSVCGGKPINGYYATSTKGGNYYGWCFTSSNKSLALSTSYNSVLARALCRLVFDENIKSVLFGCKYYTGYNYATILFECKPGDYFEDWVKSEYNVSGGNISTWGDVVVSQSNGYPYSGKITLTNSYSQSPIGTNFVYDGEFTEL